MLILKAPLATTKTCTKRSHRNGTISLNFMEKDFNKSAHSASKLARHSHIGLVFQISKALSGTKSGDVGFCHGL
jgi:hypothetical protein